MTQDQLDYWLALPETKLIYRALEVERIDFVERLVASGPKDASDLADMNTIIGALQIIAGLQSDGYILDTLLDKPEEAKDGE